MGEAAKLRRVDDCLRDEEASFWGVFRGDGWRLKNERRTAREFDSNPRQIEGKENAGATGGSPHDRR